MIDIGRGRPITVGLLYCEDFSWKYHSRHAESGKLKFDTLGI